MGKMADRGIAGGCIRVTIIKARAFVIHRLIESRVQFVDSVHDSELTHTNPSSLAY